MNHQQDKSSNARFNGKKKDEPVLTASHVLKEHRFEIKQDEIPELAAVLDPWQVLPEEDGSTGDRWSMDTGTDRIGV